MNYAGRRTLLIVGFVLASSIAIWCLPSLSRVVQCAVSYLCYPLIRVQQWSVDPCKKYLSSRQSFNQLYREHQALVQAYEGLLAEHIALKATQDLYDDVHELIDFKERYAYADACLAQVMQRTLTHDAHYFVIDKGARHGVQEQMVVVYKHMLVGKITRVFPCYAECMLITDPKCKVAVYCQRTKAQGIIKGGSDGQMQLLHVHHLASIKENDLVFSSGQGTLFPRGFGVARIVQHEKNDVTYTISCNPLIDPMQIDYCYVLKKSA